MSHHRSYILRETVISVVINILIGVAFFVSKFHGQSQVALWGAGGIVVDTLPQGFMVALMSVLPPSIITRSRIMGSKLVTRSGNSWVPPLRSILARALLTAIVGMICLTASVAMLSALSGAASMSFALGLVLKPLAGGVEAAVITPFAIRALLNRAPR